MQAAVGCILSITQINKVYTDAELAVIVLSACSKLVSGGLLSPLAGIFSQRILIGCT